MPHGETVGRGGEPRRHEADLAWPTVRTAGSSAPESRASVPGRIFRAIISSAGAGIMRTFVAAVLAVSFVHISVGVRAAPAAAQQSFDGAQIVAERVAPGVHMLVGPGGNIGVSVGEDGVFLIDDQYAPLTDRVLAALRTVSPERVRFVLNTHWHEDHTGGNENLGGAGALIVAHDNVRVRMSVEQLLEFGGQSMRVPPSPEAALPVVTFGEEVTFHINGDDIHAFHVENAHTDGDAIVHFRGADVVHMGD